jgi:hypothetical protein
MGLAESGELGAKSWKQKKVGRELYASHMGRETSFGALRR